MADICGFSHLVQEDETGTLDALVALQHQILAPAVTRNGGSVANRAGDGILAIFETAAGALNCAQEILDTSKSVAPQIDWRIGVHLADVIYEGDMVHGHGINLTSRIEAHADTNGIVVTAPVAESLSDRSNYRFRKIGRKKLKNISKPVTLYGLADKRPTIPFAGRDHLVFGVASLSVILAIALFLFPRSLPIQPNTFIDASIVPSVQSPYPSVAVLPFKSHSDEPAPFGLETAIAREIITDLTRFSGLTVFALSTTSRFDERDPQLIRQELGAEYMVAGTIQSTPETISIEVRLANTSNPRVLWSRRFHRPKENTFDIQLDIAKRVVAVVGPVGQGTGLLGQLEWKRVANTKPSDMVAYDYFLLGRLKEAKSDREGARSAYETALELDPELGRAAARLAWTYAEPYWLGFDDVLALEKAQKASDLSFSASPFDNEVLRTRGAIQMLSGRPWAGIASLQEAAELNPGDADTLMWLGRGLTYVDRPDEAITHMETAKELNPYPPAWYDWDLAWANFMAGNYEAANDILAHKTRLTSNDYLLLAATQARLGLIVEMEATSDAFRSAYPEFGWGKMAKAQPFISQDAHKHFADAMALTSIPE